MTDKDLLYEKELLTAIAGGDQQAFHVFFDIYKHRLLVFVEQLIHSRSDAEEIVQETFIKVWQSAGRLTEIEQPGHYIYMIARNKTLNHIRKISRNRRLLEEAWRLQRREEDYSLMETLQGKELTELLERTLGRLSPKKQAIFNLSRQEGLTHAEIARRLNLSQSRVKNSMVEILQCLKAAFQDYPGIGAIIFWLIWVQG